MRRSFAILRYIMETKEQWAILRRGRYRHYKGNEYDVLDIATHSETNQPVIIYREVDKPNNLWVRPLEIFLEYVNDDTPRFKLISTDDNNLIRF